MVLIGLCAVIGAGQTTLRKHDRRADPPHGQTSPKPADSVRNTAPAALSSPAPAGLKLFYSGSATTSRRSKGGQLVIHVAALPGNPYDGHTLATVIPAIETMIGNSTSLFKIVKAGKDWENNPFAFALLMPVSSCVPAAVPFVTHRPAWLFASISRKRHFVVE